MEVLLVTKREQDLLYEILECCLSDLRMQITSADNWKFKKDLKERKQEVINLMQRIKENKTNVHYEIK